MYRAVILDKKRGNADILFQRILLLLCFLNIMNIFDYVFMSFFYDHVMLQNGIKFNNMRYICALNPRKLSLENIFVPKSKT